MHKNIKEENGYIITEFHVAYDGMLENVWTPLGPIDCIRPRPINGEESVVVSSMIELIKQNEDTDAWDRGDAYCFVLGPKHPYLKHNSLLEYCREAE